jgi:DNA repair protein RadC
MDEYTVSAIRERRRRAPPRVDGPADVAALLTPILRHADREQFYAVLLTTKNGVIAIELISVGSLSASIVHPREVFKPAIVKSAACIVAVHNHPSGIPDPSAEDIEFTKRLIKGGELLGIRVLDHIILGVDSYVSLREDGHI